MYAAVPISLLRLQRFNKDLCIYARLEVVGNGVQHTATIKMHFFVKSNVHIKDCETELFHRLLSQGLGHDINGFHFTFTGFYFNDRFFFSSQGCPNFQSHFLT